MSRPGWGIVSADKYMNGDCCCKSLHKLRFGAAAAKVEL